MRAEQSQGEVCDRICVELDQASWRKESLVSSNQADDQRRSPKTHDQSSYRCFNHPDVLAERTAYFTVGETDLGFLHRQGLSDVRVGDVVKRSFCLDCDPVGGPYPSIHWRRMK